MEFGTTEGESGELEWMFEAASSPNVLVLCHPHPLYGGSMLDGVLETASRVAVSQNISTIRFNFRGVGASTGAFDHGVGEVSDLASIVREFEARYERLILCGYSFGANVALSYAAQASEDRDLVLFAPPTQDALPDLKTNVDLIVGDHDPISSILVLSDWTRDKANRNLHVIEDADHFLGAYSTDIADVLERVLAGSQ